MEEKDTGCGHVQEVLLKDMVLKIGEARTAMCKAEAEAGLTDLGVASPDPDTVNTSLMDTIHAWCKGAEFADVCEGSNLFEGSIIRHVSPSPSLALFSVNSLPSSSNHYISQPL